jgi:hypothetical protein
MKGVFLHCAYYGSWVGIFSGDIHGVCQGNSIGATVLWILSVARTVK